MDVRHCRAQLRRSRAGRSRRCRSIRTIRIGCDGRCRLRACAADLRRQQATAAEADDRRGGNPASAHCEQKAIHAESVPITKAAPPAGTRGGEKSRNRRNSRKTVAPEQGEAVPAFSAQNYLLAGLASAVFAAALPSAAGWASVSP